MKTCFLQVNQNRALAAAVELNRRLEGIDRYICLITEPYRNKCRIVAKPVGSRVLVHKSTRPPRAAIYCKGNINLVLVESLCNEDCVVGLWSRGEEKIVVASVYLDITKEVIPEWLGKICSYANKRGSPIIIGACLLYTSDAADE